MEDITDADYVHAKQACKNFEIKNVGQYHDLYVQGAILFFADVFKEYVSYNIQTRSCKIYFNSWISMASSFKKDQSKIRSFNWYQFVINGTKTYKRRNSHSICQYAKAKNKYMKDYDKSKELSYIQYWDVNKLYRWIMSR